MTDDPSGTGKQHRNRINVNGDYELRDWSQKFRVTPDHLKSVVQKVARWQRTFSRTPGSEALDA